MAMSDFRGHAPMQASQNAMFHKALQQVTKFHRASK